MNRAWQNVTSYQCTYRAVTRYGGEVSVTEMRYFYQKPGKIRMEIIKPKDGAVLIYNPDLSDKVRVRPFPGIPFFVLNYGLKDKRVSSDAGGTVDRSDLGHRIQSYCETGSAGYRMVLNPSTDLPASLEVLDGKGGTREKFEWLDLKINTILDSNLFEKF